MLPRGPLGPHGGQPSSFSFTWGALLGMTDWSLPGCFTCAWGALCEGLLACPKCARAPRGFPSICTWGPPDPTAVTSAPRLLPHFCMGSLPGVTFLSIFIPPPLHGVGGLVASPPRFLPICRSALLLHRLGSRSGVAFFHFSAPPPSDLLCCRTTG